MPVRGRTAALRALPVLCAVLLALSGCTGFAQSAGAGSARVAVSGLPQGRNPQVEDAGAAASPAPTLHFLTDVYSLGPSGPLARPAHVTFTLSRPVAKNTAVFAATRENDTQPWEYLPATIGPDRTQVSFDTTHFSLFGILGYDLIEMAQAFKTDFIDGISGGATQTDVPKPSCDSEQAARADDYQVASSTTDTVYWCLGLDGGGHRVLKVTNHRRYPLQVLHPNMTTLSNPHDYLALASLSRIGSGRYAIVAPGVTATFNADLGPGGSEGIQTEMDGVGQSLYALQTGVETLLSILTKFGAGSGKKATDAMADLLQTRSCADSLGKGSGAYLAGCFTPQQMIIAFGAKAVLLVPLMILGPVVSFLHSEWNALVDQFNHHDKYVIRIVRAAPAVTLAAFAGQWYGHTRGLEISPSGAGQESIGDGCCDPLIDLEFQLSNVTGTGPTHATATATVTSVDVHPGWTSDLGPPPHVGQQGTVSIDGGVLTDQLTAGTIYCTYDEDLKGTCGA